MSRRRDLVQVALVRPNTVSVYPGRDTEPVAPDTANRGRISESKEESLCLVDGGTDDLISSTINSSVFWTHPL